VRLIKLGNIKEWQTWRKSDQRPSNIPSNPAQTFRDNDWISMPDWLGYGKGRVLARDMLPFAVARAIVRKLKLKSQKEWRAWCKSRQRPFNIPSDPSKAYRDGGWISMPEWLGYEGRVMAKSEDRLPFTVARAIVRMLKLKSAKEWEAWCKSRQRPFMPDWLGYHPRRRQTCKWSQRFCDSDEKEHAALQSLNTPDRLRRIAARVTAEVTGQRAEREGRHRRRRRCRGGGPSTDGGDDSSNSSGSDEVKICPSPP
jgi:hypothetical protein